MSAGPAWPVMIQDGPRRPGHRSGVHGLAPTGRRRGGADEVGRKILACNTVSPVSAVAVPCRESECCSVTGVRAARWPPRPKEEHPMPKFLLLKHYNGGP